MKVQMNETRKAILKALAETTTPLTLQEIAIAIGVEKVSSGTTNPMVNAGWIVAQPMEITYNKVRTDNGMVIGTGKTTVSGYTLGTVKAE